MLTWVNTNGASISFKLRCSRDSRHQMLGTTAPHLWFLEAVMHKVM